MAFFRVKVGEKTYELPKLTLGEASVLKRHFGMADFDEFNPADPDQITGLLVLCLRRESPDAPLAKLIAEVEQLDVEEFDLAPDGDAPETDPTPPPSVPVAGGGKAKASK